MSGQKYPSGPHISKFLIIVNMYPNSSVSLETSDQYLCIYHILFSHSPIDGHSGCFHLFVIGNNAVMNMDVQEILSFLLIIIKLGSNCRGRNS